MAKSVRDKHLKNVALLRKRERAWRETELPPLLGRSDLRHWGDEAPVTIKDIAAEAIAQRRAAGIESIEALSISGGGDYGAFGAGVLSAWTQLGTRPEFTVVTGISTGALSAPFAFLGSSYDVPLKEIYSKYGRSEIMSLPSPLRVFPAISLMETEPLRGLIASYLDKATIAAIAREHERGRRLLIQTAHMDSQRPVIWDVSRIATIGSDAAADLITDVLLASASVPIAFPPVWIDAEIDGEPIAEMHMDGGVFSQITFADAWQADLQEEMSKAGHPLKSLHAILNGSPNPEGLHVGTKISSIASRALSTTFKIQFQHDLKFASDFARSRGVNFEFAYVGTDFDVPYAGPFDRDFMNALFDYGFEKCLAGRVWEDIGPGGGT